MPDFSAPQFHHSSRGRRLAGGAVIIAAGLALAACTASSGSSGTGATGSGTSGSAGAPSTSAPATATLAVDLKSDHAVNPTTPIKISVAHGTISKVTMVNQAGTHVTGALGAGDHSWHTTEVLGYGKTYTIHATATSADGKAITKTEKITTLEPKRTNSVTMDRMGGYALDGGQKYGVALIPVVHFSSPVHNKPAAQKALHVTASNPVNGVWSWIDGRDVAYRPKGYFPAHTKITVTAKIYGVNVGHGEYGASDESVSYRIGRKQTTIADDNAPQAVDKVRVYNAAGKVLRTMDTSMGQHGGTESGGQYINFYTLNGTYTVLEHDNPAIMNSTSYGLSVKDGGYGNISVPYSTKISVDGIYLHEYNSTQYDQEHGIDASEGCLNLITPDAVWFYDHSLVGDPVVVHGKKKAPEIQPWQGGYWSIPWSTWTKNSALS